MGCKTRREKEAAMVGFFGESVKGTVPGVCEHQRRRKEGTTSRKKAGKKSSGSLTSRSPSEEGGKSGRSSDASHRDKKKHDSMWRRFDNIDDLEAALKAYVDECGGDSEEGQSCAHWLRSLARAKETGKTEKLLQKWNATVEHPKKKDGGSNEDTEGKESKHRRGRSSKRSVSAGSADGEPVRPRGHSTGFGAVDREVVKEFFSGRAEEQVG